jgi:hypothetical protein
MLHRPLAAMELDNSRSTKFIHLILNQKKISRIFHATYSSFAKASDLPNSYASFITFVNKDISG